MKNIFLDTANVRKFREAITVIEDVEKGQPGLAIVYGQAGRGKTECAKQYAVQNGSVYLRIFEDMTPRAMLASICKEINGTEPYSTHACKSLACEELEKINKPLIIDEADRLKSVSMIEHFRDIHDVTGIPVILVGEQSLYGKMSSRRRIWSRVTQTVYFEKIAEEDIIIFALKAANIKIKPEAARYLKKRTDGDFRLIWLDVRDLERISKANDIKEITLDIVKTLKERKPANR